MIKLSRARVNESYIGLYGCHGVIRFDVKFWEIKIRQNFKFFTVT